MKAVAVPSESVTVTPSSSHSAVSVSVLVGDCAVCQSACQGRKAHYDKLFAFEARLDSRGKAAGT